jgi:hypothetical protein
MRGLAVPTVLSPLKTFVVDRFLASEAAVGKLICQTFHPSHQINWGVLIFLLRQRL